MSDGRFELVSSRRVFDEPPIPVRRDVVRTPDGRELTYTVLEYHDAFAGVAVTTDDKIVLVNVVRHPLGLGHKLWELPGGRLDPAESAEDCVRRELEEESGYVADNAVPLLPIFYPEPSHSPERLGLYLLTGLRRGQQREEREGLPAVRLSTLDEAYEMVLRGEIVSSWSVIGILSARLSIAMSGHILPLSSRS